MDTITMDTTTTQAAVETTAKESTATTTTTTTITSVRLVMVDSKPIVWIGISDNIPIIKNGDFVERNSLSIGYYKLVEVLQRTSNDIIKGLLSLNSTPTIGVLSTLIIGAKCTVTSTHLHEGDEINGLVITSPCYRQELKINKLPEYGSFTTNCLLKAVGEKQVFEAETPQTTVIDDLLKSL